MKSKYYLSIFIIFFYFSVDICAQTLQSIDSLKTLLLTKSGTEKVEILSKLGFEYHSVSTDSGFWFSRQALEQAEELNYKKGMSLSLRSLAANYWIKSNHEKSLECLHKSLKISEEINFNEGISLALQNIAVIHDDLKDYDKALEYYLKDIKFSEEHSTATALTYFNVGNLCNNLGKYDSALTFFDSAIKAGGDPTVVCWSVFSIGISYELKNNYKKALEYFTKALTMLENLDDKRTRAYIYSHFGAFNIKSRNYTKARNYLNEALTMAEDIDDKILMKDTYEYLAEYFAQTGNYNKAHEYLKLHAAIQDSLYIKENKKNAAEMQTKYETEEKENQIALLRKDKEKADIIRNFLISIFVIIVISFSVVYLIKTNSIKKLKEKQNVINQQKNELETANNELIEYKSHLENLNKGLEGKVAEEVKKREAQQLFLMQKSKLESLGVFSAGIAHEVNQPLTSISFTLENMQFKKNSGKLTDDYLESKFNLLYEDIKRITNIITHIKTFAREQGSIKFDKFDLNEVVQNSLLIVNAQLRNKNINLELDLFETPVYVLGNKYRLEQVLLNLILNARYAVESKALKPNSLNYHKTILIKTYNEEDSSLIIVEDNGTGIPKERKLKIFEPFFTTKEPDSGTGLGLSIAYGIVQEHNGEISVESIENEFTRFIIKLPKV